MSNKRPDIAIIGMAGRFPKAKDVKQLWQNLCDGVESVTYFSDEDLRRAGVEEDEIRDPNYVKSAMFLEDVDLFDAAFFGINPREAELTDPAQRILLECAWQALEDAGHDPERYAGSIGVFAGAAHNVYLIDHILPRPDVIESVGALTAGLVNEKDFVATRLSYLLNLQGPGVSVNTACSTSMVAVHLGCQSLFAGDSDMVLAGGACIATLRKEGYLYIDGGVFSRDGRVYSFDHRASGQVGGNGAAIIVMKRLEDAIADGDTIRAVIKGTALNNDGINKVSFSAPSVHGEASAIVSALEAAGVHPESISYVETHGTGTQVGDPIEIEALTKAYRTLTQKTGYCPIGSVKTNIGHLDAGSGAAGLIKTALALQNKLIPPSLNYERANPEIDFESSPFFVNTELRKWETDQLPRRAGVSAFGMGGTNGHVILEEAPEPAPTSEPARRYELLCVSARNKTALGEAADRMKAHLEEANDQSFSDIAYTTHVGRRAFEVRRAIVCRDREDALDALEKQDGKRNVTATRTKGGRSVAFLFTGQGAQYPNMARGLYESEPTFRAELDRCCEHLKEHLGRDLRELLFPPASTDETQLEAVAKELALTQNTQPALFVIEYALAKLLGEWGVEPDAMVGHSIGEYVAACLAGVFSLEDALRVVAARGRLIGSLPEGGAMLAVHLSEVELTPHLDDGLCVAAINAPGLCVVSGPVDGIERLAAKLDAADVGTRKLHTSHAFHSSLMDPILAPFTEELGKVALRAPERRFVSCATGTWITDAEATDPQYWVRHVRQPVRFVAAIETLLAETKPLLLEVGPGQTLSSLARMCAGEKPDVPILSSTRHPQEERDDVAFLLRTLGELWALGVEIGWEAFHAREQRRRVPLPSYPFQRQRFWIERSKDGWGSKKAPKKNPNVADWFYATSWKRAPMPRLVAKANAGPKEEQRSLWLLFADRGGMATELAGRLEEAGIETLSVTASDGFERVDEHNYQIDPRNPADYTDLFEDLRKRSKQIGHVVHLWGVDPYERTSLRSLAAVQETGFFSLLFLAQTFSAHPTDGEIVLDVVTSGMQEVIGDELTHPEKATVLGCCKAINAEIAGVRCRSIDVDAAQPGSAAFAGTLDHLLAELRSVATDPFIAHRGRHRWLLCVEKVELDELEAEERLRERGVYLITGGLGGIGLALAEYLAEEVQARLVLTGRSALPAPEAWDAWVQEHGEDDSASQKIREVRRLEQLGAEVLTLSADVADPESMRKVVQAAKQRFGAVNGVIHSAGVAGAGLIELKSRGAARNVLAPKVRGTQVLHEVLKDEELDFVVHCSSLATAINGAGQVDYFAANAYLDAFANHERSAGKPWTVAVGWDAWQEVGMAVNTAIPAILRKDREESLKMGISPKEGREAFRRILGSSLSQVYVTARDLPKMLLEIEEELEQSAREAAIQPEAGAAATPSTSGDAHARPELATEYAEPANEIEKTVASIWADLLGIDRVGRDDDVFELGGNSLLLMQLGLRLRSVYGVKLPIRALFETPTVASLAERLQSARVLT